MPRILYKATCSSTDSFHFRSICFLLINERGIILRYISSHVTCSIPRLLLRNLLSLHEAEIAHKNYCSTIFYVLMRIPFLSCTDCSNTTWLTILTKPCLKLILGNTFARIQNLSLVGQSRKSTILKKTIPCLQLLP